MVQKQLEPLFGSSPDKITMIKFVFIRTQNLPEGTNLAYLTPCSLCSPIHDFKCISFHMCEEYFYIIYHFKFIHSFNPNFRLLTNPSSYTIGDNRYI